MDKNVRQKFRTDFLKIRKLINKFDPCSYIHPGVRDDEYDDLTLKIISLSYLGWTKEDLRTKVLYDLENFYNFPAQDFFTDNRQIEIQFHEDLDTLLNGVDSTIGGRASR